MGIRLENILVLLIGMIVAGFFFAEIGTKIQNEISSTRELEFTDTSFVEVDTNGTLGLAHSSLGLYEDKTLYLKELVYHTRSIDVLQAKEATMRGDIINLEGDVTLNQKRGFEYKTQNAIYDKKSEILTIPSPFVAKMNDNVIRGSHLIYDTKSKKILGNNIDAVIYTFEP